MSARSPLPVSVSDVRSNRNEQIEHAVNCLRSSKRRLAVFKAVYHHKRRSKSVPEVALLAGISEKAVLTAGIALVQQHLMGQSREGGRVVYHQDPFYQAEKRRILRLVQNPKQLARLPTKRRPEVKVSIRTKHSGAAGRVEFLTVDTIDSFSRVQGVPPQKRVRPFSEEAFKLGIQRVIAESGVFKDWGGEQSDVFTTQLVVHGRRRRTAFAFKGPGKQVKKLRPKDMGKNGDQIPRLFKSAADVFIVQYHGEIHEDTVDLMDTYARRRASERGSTVYYCVINGQDSNRLAVAYREAFAARPKVAKRSGGAARQPAA